MKVVDNWKVKKIKIESELHGKNSSVKFIEHSWKIIESSWFYSEHCCEFSRTLLKCLYPWLLNSSIQFTKLFFPYTVLQSQIFWILETLK